MYTLRSYNHRVISVMYYICIFFFNDTATTEIYTLSLHDALPISVGRFAREVDIELNLRPAVGNQRMVVTHVDEVVAHGQRSEEHTSELQSQSNLVCRLLLEKKNIENV